VQLFSSMDHILLQLAPMTVGFFLHQYVMSGSRVHCDVVKVQVPVTVIWQKGVDTQPVGDMSGQQTTIRDATALSRVSRPVDLLAVAAGTIIKAPVPKQAIRRSAFTLDSFLWRCSRVM
jgi:hypothetical protein